MGEQSLNGGQGTTGPQLETVLFLLYEYGLILVCNLSSFAITEW